MKNYFKGVATGLVLAIVVAIIPVFASNLDIGGLNLFRIRTYKGDVVQWNETYDRNGTQLPTSIIYKDTTYLPIRKISELLNTSIYFDSASNTISLMGIDYDSLLYRQDIKNTSDGQTYRYEVWGSANYSTLRISMLNANGEVDPNRIRSYAIPRNNSTTADNESQYVGNILFDTNSVKFLSYWSNNTIQEISYNFDANSEDGATYTVSSDGQTVLGRHVTRLLSNDEVVVSEATSIVNPMAPSIAYVVNYKTGAERDLTANDVAKMN